MRLIIYVLRVLGIKYFNLPKTEKAAKLYKVFSESEEVTDSFIGFITHSVFKEVSGDKVKWKKRLDAVTIWIAPHLFIIGLRKQK